MRTPKPIALATALLTAFSPLSGLAQTARRVEAVQQKTSGLPGGGGRWAVIVGVDKYQSTDIPPLEGAVADARAIADALTRYADFSPQQVLTLTSDASTKPTATAILDRFSELRGAVKPGDLLLFFFAGHGVEVEGRRFLLTHESKVASAGALKTSTLPVSVLMQEIESIPVAHRVIMVDACRDDPISRGGRQPNVATATLEAAFTLQPSSEGGVRATFLSSTRGQSAYEWSEKGRGFFSYYIEKGLSGEAAVFGKVTVTSLATYLNENVPQAVRQQRGKQQTPFMDLKGEQLVLVRGERMAVNPEAQRAPAPPATRTVYGILKDSSGVPIQGSSVRLAWAGGATRGTASKSTGPQQIRIETDEDGFFKVEVPTEATVAISAGGTAEFEARTVTAPPTEAGKKVRLFLPRVAPPTPVRTTAVASARPPASTAPVAAKPPAAAAAPAPAKPATTTTAVASAKPPASTTPATPKPPTTATAPAPAKPATATTAVASVRPPAPTAPDTVRPPAATTAPTPAKPPASTTAVASAKPPAPTAPATVKPPAATTAPAPTKPAPSTTAVASARPPASASAPPAPVKPAAPAAPTRKPPAAPATVPSLSLAEIRAQELAKVAYQSFVVEDFKEAENAARNALDSDQDNQLAEAIVANCLAVYGVNHQDKKKLAVARELTEKVLKANPQMGLAHNAMGLVLYGANDIKGAQREFSSAKALEPNLSVAGANLGYTYFQRKKYKDAEKAFRAAIKARPDAAVPYNGLAQVLIARKKAGDAVKAAREAISRYELRDEYLGSFYVNLAVALYQDNKRDAALEAVARAKALGVTKNPAYEVIEKAPKSKKDKKGKKKKG